MDRKTARDATDAMRQNFVLSLFKETDTTSDKIKKACQGGVSSVSEMASLLNKEGLSRQEKLIMASHHSGNGGRELPVNVQSDSLNLLLE